MKANELRIGNYVNPINRSGEVHLPDTKYILEIVSLKYHGVDCILQGQILAQIEPEETQYFDISPIELTEEWLIKFGFESLEHCSVGYSIYHNGIEIKFLNSELYCYVNDISTHHIKYVHQLQNLYFALTDEELTIK